MLPGTPYDPCFVEGDCAGSTLDAIHTQSATFRIVYLQVDPGLAQDLHAIPLRFADTNWVGGQIRSLSLLGRAEMWLAATRTVVLPLIFSRPTMRPLPEARPLGFFDPGSGRMVGYLP